MNTRITNIETAIKSLTDLVKSTYGSQSSHHPPVHNHQDNNNNTARTPKTTPLARQEKSSSRRIITSPTGINQSPEVDESSLFFQIKEHVVQQSLDQCRSRRNLAGRLCDHIFTTEKTTSNYRGVKNKKSLDKKKTAAIKRVCLTHFPPNPHEPMKLVDRDIREGVDEMCRRCARKGRLEGTIL